MAGYRGEDAVKRIRQLAAMGVEVASLEHAHAHAGEADGAEDVFAPGCTIRTLPDRLQVDAAGVAAALNPFNLPPGLTRIAAAIPDSPLELTLLVSKYFGPAARTLTVSFMEETPADLRDRIIQHMNAWNNCCGVNFRFTAGIGQVRISRAGSGYWSFLGTDILLIPQNKPTMNLQNFSMLTRESEYKRVVRHETGHTLGFPHEHMRRELVARIDPAKAYVFFKANQGWSEADVNQQVLTPLDQASIFGTAADQNSIMCYQLPASIMKDGKPILGGLDINATDCNFAGVIYRKQPGQAAAAPQAPQEAPRAGRAAAAGLEAPVGGHEDFAQDWSAKEDVDAAAVIEEFRGRGGTAG